MRVDTRPQEAPRQQPSQSDTPFSATATQEHSSTSGLAQNPEANRLIEQIIEDLGISSASDKAAQSLAQQHDDARKFVSLLSFYGYVFKHLIDETFYFTNNADWGWLAKLYKELKISESQVQQQEEPVNMGQQQSAASDTSKLSQAAAKEPLPKSTPRADGLLREPPRGPASTSRTPSRASQKTSAKPQESKPAAKPAETKSAAKAEETKSTTAPAFGQPSSLGDKPIGKPALPQSQPGGATQSPGTDRASYLAKLKAAKMKVGSKANETIAKSNASSATPPVQAPKPAQQPASRIAQPAGKTGSAGAMEDIVTEPAVPVPSSVQDDAETRKKAQTELLQKKLAELKAKQGSQPAPKPSVPAPSQDALPAAPNGPDLHTQNIAFVQNSFPHVAPTFSQAQGSPPQAGSPTGGIPGLFMSTAPPNASPQPAGQDSSQTRPRKRPVAADFDDFNSETPLRPSKRPTFGDDPSAVNVDEKMVIDVSSDDESDNDGGVDLLEDVDDLINAAAQNVPNQQKQRALRDVGPLTNFPARGQVSIRSSALSTPGGTNTPHPDQLSDMDAKIAMLKAEIIAKQAAQKRRGESRPQTPFKKPDKAGEPPQLRGGEAAHSSPISEQNHLLTRNGREAPLLSQIAAAPASSIRSQSPVEHRLRRQSEIESIDASVSSNISKVELLHREIQALEADNKKRLEEKEALAKELEDNGVDTEGMGDEEMKAARDEIRVQQEQEQRQNEEVAVVEDTGLTEQTDRADLDVLPEAQDDIEAAPIVLSEELPSTDRALDMITEAQQFNSDAQPIEEPSNDTDVRQDVVNDSLLGINEDCEPRVQETGNDQDEETMNFEIYGDSNAEIVAAADPSPQLQMEGIIDTAAPDMAADTQNQDQEMQEGDDESEDFYSPGDAEQASLPQPIVPATAPADDFEMSDDEDTFTPDPPAEADILPETTAIPPNAVLQEDMQMSDGEVAETPTQEVAASASSSPDSIAAIEAAERPAAEEVPRGYPGTFTPETSSEDSSEEEEEDDYEPPGPVDGAVEAEPATALEDGAVIQEVVEEEDYEPPDADDDSQDSGSALVINDMQSARQSGTPEEGAVPLADDLAPELQPNPAADELSHTPTATEGYFRPYESSLASFKAYRYHPQFTENVQGGFRSMTYSHKIDPHKELCQYEADGGVCNDKDCQHQHYRDMKLTGAFSGH